MLEEAGCEVEVTGEIGIIIEERGTWHQTNYCYLGKVTKKGTPVFTSEEEARGCKIKRFTLEDAISTINNDTTTSPDGKVLVEREKLILETVRSMV
ncbi:hypothetical protein KA013_01335 [Patescibacteria group bacterium]|nr:hypothetical protein [Patescibacteria group bacterium]